MGAPAPLLDMGQRDLTVAFSEALKREFGNDRQAVVAIAEAANSNTRAAQNWLYGNNLPDFFHGLFLFARVPGLQAELRRLLAMESDLDPRIEQAISELVTQVQRAKGQGA